MRVSTAIFLTYLAALASTKPIKFTMFSASSGTQFWDLPINAYNGGFYVNRPAKKQCPNPEKTHCTTSTNTIIHGDDVGGPMSLESMIPGGQDIYIAKDGMLGYAKPNSTLFLNGAMRNPKGFTYGKAKGRRNDMGYLTYSGGCFTLCGPEDRASPAYKLYIDDGKNKFDEHECTPILLGARETLANEKVWAYE